MQQGLHVYTQKPLTQTIYEARQLTRVAREKKLVTQMGIQIHSHEVHRTIVATIQAGTIGKVKEVHSWSGKHWGDSKPRPSRVDKVPKDLNWNLLAGRRRRAPVPGPLLSSRASGASGSISAPARLATWGATSSIRFTHRSALTAPSSIRSEGGAPNARQLGPRFPGALYLPGDEAHDRDTHALLVRRRQTAPRGESSR